jgi:hypothetical protein
MRKGNHDEFDRQFARAQRAARLGFAVILVGVVALMSVTCWAIVELVEFFTK